MSIHSPLSAAGSRPSPGDAGRRRVRCDLPVRLEVLPGEVDLIEAWLGDLVADLFGGNGTAATGPDRSDEGKEK